MINVFINSRHFTYKQAEKLEKLGYKVSLGKHPKMYINLDKTYVVTLTSSASDCQAGRQTLRQIRRIYEEYENDK